MWSVFKRGHRGETRRKIYTLYICKFGYILKLVTFMYISWVVMFLRSTNRKIGKQVNI